MITINFMFLSICGPSLNKKVNIYLIAEFVTEVGMVGRDHLYAEWTSHNYTISFISCSPLASSFICSPRFDACHEAWTPNRSCMLVLIAPISIYLT